MSTPAKSQFKKKEHSLTEWISLPCTLCSFETVQMIRPHQTHEISPNSRNLSSDRPKFDVFRGPFRVSDPADRSKDRHFGCIPMIIPMISQFLLLQSCSIMTNPNSFIEKTANTSIPKKSRPGPSLGPLNHH